MTLYRAKPGDGTAWVTGASTGIGRALALDLARKGYNVAITARSMEELETVAKGAADLGGRIVPFPCDVMDEQGMAKTVRSIERELGPIVLTVLNAGTFLPVRGARMETTNFVRSFEINVFGTVFGLVPVIDHMSARGYGHLVFMGSVTAYYGMPSAAAYGATKAALNNMAEALRFDLEKMNIRIQVINPGFVDTPLTRKNRFPMPALVSADEASRRIVKGLESGGFETTFPRRFTWPLKALRLLPRSVVFRILDRLTGRHNRRPGPSASRAPRRR